MKEVRLCNALGVVALVDDIDYESLAEHRWRLQRARGGLMYAVSVTAVPRTMHALVAGRAGIVGDPLLDHRNRNGLDNRRLNLRPATYAQNGWNQLRPYGASGFPGVHRNRNAWAVRFDHCGAPVYFGTHRDLDTAKSIAARELLRLRGEFLEDTVKRMCLEQLAAARRAA